MNRYQVHQVNKAGTVLKSMDYPTKRAAVVHYKFLAAALGRGDLVNKKTVEVCLYDECVSAMLMTTAKEGN